MATAVTINRPDVVAQIEATTNSPIGGHKTEAVAMAMRDLLAEDERLDSVFGMHPRSVRVRDGVDLVAPIFEDTSDAETGYEIDR